MTQQQNRLGRIVGWSIATAYILISLLNTVLPRTEKTSALRETYRGYHYVLGLALLILVIWRLVIWFRERPEQRATALLPGPVTTLMHQLCLWTLVLLALAALFGAGHAWSGGYTLHLAGLIDLPALMPESKLGWQFTGYFHSGISIAVRLIAIVAVLVGAYTLLRYGTGMLRAFPAGFGALFYTSVVIFVYALNSFAQARKGYIAAGIFLAVTAVWWLVAVLIHRRRRPAAPEYGRLRSTAHPIALTASLALVAAVVGYGLYMPHQLFRVTPWPMGVKVEGPSGATSHAAPVQVVKVRPPSEFEARVNAETFRWCRFCHTFKEGEKPLVGPNLYAIFGQQAGTVPNFYYSKAMAEAGRNGLVWTDETLSKYLASPDGFVPGTSMIISSGPVSDQEVRAAVINILKRETMPESHQQEWAD